MTILWTAESLRLTVFPVALPSEKPEFLSLLWSLTGKGQAEEIIHQPSQGISIAKGKTSAGSQEAELTLQLMADRVHWIESPMPVLGSEYTGWHTLGLFQDALTEFANTSKVILDNAAFPQIKRMAFGTILLFSVKSREEGYNHLGKLLPGVKIDSKGSSDFSYTINRPRLIDIGEINLKINRLSKWFVQELLNLKMRFAPGDVGATAERSGYFVLRSEIDISSDAIRELAIPKEILGNLFDNMVKFGIELSESGDVP